MKVSKAMFAHCQLMTESRKDGKIEYSADDSYLEQASGKEVGDSVEQAKCETCGLVARNQEELQNHARDAHAA